MYNEFLIFAGLSKKKKISGIQFIPLSPQTQTHSNFQYIYIQREREETLTIQNPSAESPLPFGFLALDLMAGDDAAAPPTAEMASASLTPSPERRRREYIASIVGRGAVPDELIGKRIRVGGWVKTGREQGKGAFAFLELNDGSCLSNLQVIVNASVFPLAQLVHTGTSVLVEGELKKPPEGVKQRVELHADRVLEVGPADPSSYPIPKTRLTLEFLRDIVHLRPRTNTVYVFVYVFFSVLD